MRAVEDMTRSADQKDVAAATAAAFDAAPFGVDEDQGRSLEESRRDDVASTDALSKASNPAISISLMCSTPSSPMRSRVTLTEPSQSKSSPISEDQERSPRVRSQPSGEDVAAANAAAFGAASLVSMLPALARRCRMTPQAALLLRERRNMRSRQF